MFIEVKHIKDYTYYFLAQTFRVNGSVKKARIFIGPDKITSPARVGRGYHIRLKRKIKELARKHGRQRQK